MQARYEIRIYDTGGYLKYVLDSWDSLDYTLKLNDYDEITLVLPGDHPAVAYFVLDAIVEVWRTPEGRDRYRDAVFLHRTPQYQITDTGKYLFTSYGRGLCDLMNRREIWYSGVAFTKKVGPGETAMKSYVDENAGPGASNTARQENGVIQGLSIQSDQGRGTSWTGDRPQRNLLDVLQEISAASGVDFTVYRAGFDGINFVFYTNYPQLGADRSATVEFSTKLGNMQNPIFVSSRTEEATSVLATGTASSARIRLVSKDALRAGESPWNLIERSQNASQEDTTAGLQSAADAALVKFQPQEKFTFTVLQTAATQYGRDYFLGDKIKASIQDISRTLKITEVHINVATGKEDINLGFALTGRVVS